VARTAAKRTIIDTTKAVRPDLTAALKSRSTAEIVIGFVGPIASGVTTASQQLESLIAEKYGYSAERIRLSELIEKNADRVGAKAPIPSEPSGRIAHLQGVGTELRRRFGAGYLAAKAIELISVERGKSGYTDQELQDPLPRRVVHIIDSIKNEQEAEVFRLVYGSAFWLVGVFAPKSVRRRRLRADGFTEAEASDVMERDEHEGPLYGQDVRETYDRSDFFLKNETNSKSALTPSIVRLLAAIFEDGIVTPTADERGMAGARQSAAASACLSRQVGAVIVSKSGSVLGNGWNEVPRAGGGVYDGTGDLDARCFVHGERHCRNDEQKQRLYEEIHIALRAQLNADASASSIQAALKTTGIRSLIEFSRSVHAEMAAIVDVARSGRGALDGSSMYVTTFPCHNCARHIIASGITRVVYIEPYPKSLAVDLHDDALADGASESSKATDRKVEILPFEGIGPGRFFSVFLMREERKESGKLKNQTPNEKLPADSETLDAFATLEKRVVQHLLEIEGDVKSQEPAKSVPSLTAVDTDASSTGRKD
jgi:deoxycytidylate deaminase